MKIRLLHIALLLWVGLTAYTQNNYATINLQGFILEPESNLEQAELISYGFTQMLDFQFDSITGPTAYSVELSEWNSNTPYGFGISISFGSTFAVIVYDASNSENELFDEFYNSIYSGPLNQGDIFSIGLANDSIYWVLNDVVLKHEPLVILPGDNPLVSIFSDVIADDPDDPGDIINFSSDFFTPPSIVPPAPSFDVSGLVLFPENIDCTADYIMREVEGIKIDIFNEGSSAPITVTSDTSGIFMASIQEGLVTIKPRLESSPFYQLDNQDRMIISDHINGIELIECPFKRIAADVNMDGKIDSLDLYTIHEQVIGGEIVGTPWRFIPRNYVYPNSVHPDPVFVTDFWQNTYAGPDGALYPFQAQLNYFGKTYSYQGSLSWMGELTEWFFDSNTICGDNQFGFYMVRVGDVDGDASTDFSAPVFYQSPDDEINRKNKVKKRNFVLPERLNFPKNKNRKLTDN